MIADANTAKYVSDLLLDINGQLNESIERVQEASTPEEFANYRRRVGTLINSIFEEVLEPIYRKHPNLKPPELEV
ncbi:MAG: hypothetical protein WA639_20225 [Candidatus Acidiferrum sp.]